MKNKGGRKMKAYRLTDHPNIMVLHSIMESSILKGKSHVLNETELEIKPLNIEDEQTLLRMISEYSVFMMMDRYLRQRLDLFTLSSYYYDEVLEEALLRADFSNLILRELNTLLEEQKEDEHYLIKLFPLRTFQAKELFYEIDDWFIENENELLKKGTPSVSQEQLEETQRAFSELTLEVGNETIYLKNADEAYFSAESLFEQCELAIQPYPELENCSELTKWEKHQLTLLLTFFDVLVVSKLHLYEKDRRFFERLFDLMETEVLEEIEVIWHE